MADGSEPFRPKAPTPRSGPVSLARMMWITWRDPLRIWSERHLNEDILYGESILGRAATVSAPEGVKHVLVDNARNYEKGPLQRRVLGPLLGEGLLLVEGEDWKRARRTLAPLFRPARVTQTAARMAQVCQARVGGWLDGRSSAVLDLDAEMTGLTFDILSATLFSDALGGEAKEFELALNAFLDNSARIDPLDVLAAPSWIPRMGRLMGRRATTFFTQRVAELVASRRRQIETGGAAPDDILTALLRAQDPETGAGLTELQVAANVITFVLAGHETTARALGWTLHLLSRSPEALAHVEAEATDFDVASRDWADAMPWTRAVIEEAMRLFPPAPTMTRLALADDVICGVPIPAGTTILISPWVIQRHRKLWHDPDAFRPERFLPGAREAIDRFAYIPFSDGPRVCIGASFAIQEAMIALATILRGVRIEALSTYEPMPTHRITLRAAGGIRLRIKPR